MKVPTCPDHGKRMLDLACGRLDDADAMEAELVRESCPHCGAWWSTAFPDDATSRVDAAVEQAFAEFSPAAGRRRAWLAAAAVAVLTVGIGATTMLWRGAEVAPAAAEKAPAAGAVLSVWDFEDGRLVPTSAAVVPTPDAPGEVDEAVFINDLESGDLSSWTFHS